ncbi:hypothetical protein ACQUY5_23710 [Bacillus cereus]|uniref:hypothetical protein n=1 Tax=Bacillus cereus TaxID=1396 RepID=UPI003D1652F0
MAVIGKKYNNFGQTIVEIKPVSWTLEEVFENAMQIVSNLGHKGYQFKMRLNNVELTFDNSIKSTKDLEKLYDTEHTKAYELRKLQLV